jgi:hypothetical protein
LNGATADPESAGGEAVQAFPGLGRTYIEAVRLHVYLPGVSREDLPDPGLLRVIQRDHFELGISSSCARKDSTSKLAFRSTVGAATLSLMALPQ